MNLLDLKHLTDERWDSELIPRLLRKM